MTPSLSSLLVFAGIALAIPLLLWLLKRSPWGAALGGAARTGLPLRTVSSLPLGPQQRVVTIELGEGAERRWLVLGVTPHHVGTLHVIDTPPSQAAPIAAATVAPPAFAAVLRQFRRGEADDR